MCKIEIRQLTEDCAKEICNWRYKNEYKVYNLLCWEKVVNNNWSLASKKKRIKEYRAFTVNKELIGYGRFHEKDKKI